MKVSKARLWLFYVQYEITIFILWLYPPKLTELSKKHTHFFKKEKKGLVTTQECFRKKTQRGKSFKANSWEKEFFLLENFCSGVRLLEIL